MKRYRGSFSLRHDRQDGQALFESMVAVLALAALWAAVHWLAQGQDIALSAIHASRHAAFLATRSGPGEPLPADRASGVADRYLTGRAHRWANLYGERLLDPARDIQLSTRRDRSLSAGAQPGGDARDASTLRRDWLLADTGILRASVTLHPQHRARGDAKEGPLGMVRIDTAYPALQRSTHVLTGAGHAPSDAQAQQRTGSSGLAWAAAHSASRAAGVEVAGRADGIDSGWGRADPRFDWLDLWSGRVPAHLIDNHQGH